MNFINIEDYIAEQERDPHTKVLLDKARAELKARIELAGGLEHLIEVEPFALSSRRETTEGAIAAKCQRIEGSGEICGLTPPCPDCGSSLIDVPEGE
jgi:hypothetical protein